MPYAYDACAARATRHKIVIRRGARIGGGGLVRYISRGMLSAGIPWVITRERDDGQPLVDALVARGLRAMCIPAIDRAPLPWPAPLAAADDDRDDDDLAVRPLWFLTSPYAARLTLDHLGARARGARFAALAPRTVEVLALAGLAVEVSTDRGAAALAHAVVGARARGPVYYPTSNAGLGQPEQGDAVDVLARAGVAVVRGAVYLTTPSQSLRNELAALDEAWFGVVWSPSAIAAVAAAVLDGAPAPVFLACVGASTLRAAEEARVAAAALVPRDVDLADFCFAYPRLTPAAGAST